MTTSSTTPLDPPSRELAEVTGQRQRDIREPFVEFAKDSEGWHWCLWSGNGNPLCRSVRAYQEKKHAVQAAEAAQKNWACVRVMAVVT